MRSNARALRDHLALVGEAKAQARRSDVAEHLAGTLGARLDATARLAQQWIDAGSVAHGDDDESATWRRVLAHLEAAEP